MSQNDSIVNLDELFPDTDRFIIHKGDKHQILQPSTGDYMKMLLLRRNLLKQNQGVEDEFAQMSQAVELVAASIPSIPKGEVERMGIRKVMKLIEVIETTVDIQKEQGEGAENGDTGESTSS